MFRTIRLGKWFGIETYIHWSFTLFMLWVLLSVSISGGIQQGLNASLFFFFFFVCVYFHELGHAKAAKTYGIETHDITLLPIGGLARLASMPRSPKAEIVVAIAGPAVNVLIAAMMAIVLLIAGGINESLQSNPIRLGFLQQLFAVNVILVVFNLIPAFPMDGGRILRAILAMRFGHLRGTSIAARIGRYLALLMMVVGLFTSFSLILVGIFVLVAGFKELMDARRQAIGESGWMPAGFGNDFSGLDRSPRTTSPDDVLEAESVRRVD